MSVNLLTSTAKQGSTEEASTNDEYNEPVKILVGDEREAFYVNAHRLKDLAFFTAVTKECWGGSKRAIVLKEVTIGSFKRYLDWLRLDRPGLHAFLKSYKALDKKKQTESKGCLIDDILAFYQLGQYLGDNLLLKAVCEALTKAVDVAKVDTKLRLVLGVEDADLLLESAFDKVRGSILEQLANQGFKPVYGDEGYSERFKDAMLCQMQGMLSTLQKRLSTDNSTAADKEENAFEPAAKRCKLTPISFRAVRTPAKRQ